MEAHNPPPRYLSIYHAAEHMDVCVATIYRWIRQGLLSAVKIGGTYRIPTSALESLPDVLGGKGGKHDPPTPTA